jgi:DNA polymerase-3 subunit delta'
MRPRLPHALLFSGMAGIGKRELAETFAASLLCEGSADDGLPCGECVACRWLAEGNHPDLRRLCPSALDADEEGGEASSRKPSFDITIDQVRALDDFLRVGGHRQGLRVILLYPAEAMNRNTANALLKALEEPGEGTHFLLVSSRPGDLLPTVRSRCQHLPIPCPPAEAARCWLAERGVMGASEMLALAGGAPLAAEGLAEKSKQALLAACLQFLRAGARADPLAASLTVEGVLSGGSRGGELRVVVDWMQRWVHDLACCCNRLAPRYFPGEATALRDLCAEVSERCLHKYNRILSETKKLSEHPLNNRLFIYELFLEYRGIFSSGDPNVR